jgi:hypothetical protein
VNPQPRIRLLLLWKYSRESLALNSEDMEHLRACQDCVAVLWLCNTSSSLDRVEKVVSEVGVGTANQAGGEIEEENLPARSPRKE